MQADDSDSGICLLAWKRRTGWSSAVLRTPAARLMSSSSSSSASSGASLWEERWIVCTQNGELRYYAVGDGEDEQVPRGCMDLVRERPRINVVSKPSSDAPTPHELDISVVASTSSTSTSMDPSPITASNKNGSNGSSNTNKHWRFCFHTQQDLMQFLQVTHRVQAAAGQYDRPAHLKNVDPSKGLFEHEFQAGDHVYRWEMICCPPVIYPIQIHGIVLEAGRNCVMLADFGLTGYSDSRKEGQEFNHQQQHHAAGDDDPHHAILVAYYNKILRPSNHQRLNIVTLTDPMEIRKWTKANYDDARWGCQSSSGKKLAALSKFLSKLSTAATKTGKTKKSSSKSSSNDTKANSKDKDDYTMEQNEEDGTDDHTDGNLSLSQRREYEDDADDDGTPGVVSNDKSMDSSESSDTQRSRNKKISNTNKKEQLPLPRSDPVPIVLARANFLLEHENELPPYHVLYSNSECIAVWCKTGRWSTLQTAVFLSTNAVGGAKSATLATLGVAAAHALLAPVVAVGGLIWVSTPLWLLQKARHKWQEATEQMNQAFWAVAEPRVYVAAIEHWSGLTTATTTTTTTVSSASTENNNTVAEKDNNSRDEEDDKKPSAALLEKDNDVSSLDDDETRNGALID